MPELPEVEHARGLADALLGRRELADVRCHRDDIVFDGVSPARVSRHLKGRRVEKVSRWGKYLWFELDRRPWPLFHFGMTGAFKTPGTKALPLATAPHDPLDRWPPRFTKIHLVASDGGELVMTNSRRLGRIRLVDDPRSCRWLAGLGFDPYLALPSLSEFRHLLGRRHGTLKGLLLNQSFAAGVGNWIADEVLYQAGLDPRRSADDLGSDEVRRLRTKLRHVVATAVEVDAHKDRFPRRWLFHRRWGKKANAHTWDGSPIEHITVAGRTTAWVPSRQR